MLIGKLIEMVLQYFVCQLCNRIGEIFSPNLKQEAFLQGTGSHSRGIKLLDYHQNLMQGFI